MRVIGVTGGVGAGKSEILSFLEREYGARILRADEAAHELMERGGSCYDEIIALLGPDITDENGNLDRKAIAARIFGRDDLRLAVNAIVHPAVRRHILEDMEESRASGRELYVVEAALLLEDNYDEICDEIWYIYADEGVRRQRLAQSRGYSDEKTTAIMNSQMPDAEFRKRCRVVIDNSGEFGETIEQIRRVLSAGEHEKS